MDKTYPVLAFDPFFRFQKGLLKNLKYEYLSRERWLPIEKKGEMVTVLIDDPANLPKRDSIEALLKTKAIQYVTASPEDIDRFIEYAFDIEGSLSTRTGEDAAGPDERGEESLVTETDSVIVRLVNKIITQACEQRASDIHIEPDVKDRDVKVRFRIDGECIPYKSLPFEYRSAVVSRIKIMANLDITERRLPQDGKIAFKKNRDEEIELRVATIPTHGSVEDVVLRILTKGRIMSLDELAMPDETLRKFKEILKKPYGLILIVGPTGSGKTTTAHAALQVLNQPHTKIWTAEDPVEITQQGLRQVQVHHKIGFDFAQAMRAFLRADPDVIMVGEMRDYETAKMGIEASLTGHLVLSTLHTNNAPETIVRLLDMGIDPFAFADSLLCVLAQRLVRSLCHHCKEAYRMNRLEQEELVRYYGEKYWAETQVSLDELVLYRPMGCRACNKTGYMGRMGLFELLVVTEQIKHHIINRRPISSLRRTAMGEGMRTLLQDGILKIVAGRTDLTEVLGVCMR
ncbi:MAG: GspE/PulE family protein [Syntrophales bacterium]|nr:GspE/PulE family protein [Syntrophales bacterium]